MSHNSLHDPYTSSPYDSYTSSASMGYRYKWNIYGTSVQRYIYQCSVMGSLVRVNLVRGANLFLGILLREHQYSAKNIDIPELKC